jgi:hypothetical protein
VIVDHKQLVHRFLDRLLATGLIELPQCVVLDARCWRAGAAEAITVIVSA